MERVMRAGAWLLLTTVALVSACSDAGPSADIPGLTIVSGAGATDVGADADDRLTIPCGPEGHLGCPEPGEVERVRAPRRGLCPRSGHMGTQQFDDARVVQATFDDVHADLDRRGMPDV